MTASSFAAGECGCAQRMTDSSVIACGVTTPGKSMGSSLKHTRAPPP
jgi:hypothetical protein